MNNMQVNCGYFYQSNVYLKDVFIDFLIKYMYVYEKINFDSEYRLIEFEFVIEIY